MVNRHIVRAQRHYRKWMNGMDGLLWPLNNKVTLPFESHSHTSLHLMNFNTAEFALCLLSASPQSPLFTCHSSLGSQNVCRCVWWWWGASTAAPFPQTVVVCVWECLLSRNLVRLSPLVAPHAAEVRARACFSATRPSQVAQCVSRRRSSSFHLNVTCCTCSSQPVLFFS